MLANEVIVVHELTNASPVDGKSAPAFAEDLCGKFTFSAPSYSVLESAGTLEVEIIFHRKKPSQSKMKVAAVSVDTTKPIGQLDPWPAISVFVSFAERYV